jgi:hypothetical protein
MRSENPMTHSEESKPPSGAGQHLSNASVEAIPKASDFGRLVSETVNEQR